MPREKLLRLHASSGTTGKPIVVGYTMNDLNNWADLVARSIYAAGGRPGDMVHVAYGYGMFTGGLGATMVLSAWAALWYQCRASDRKASLTDSRFQARHHHGDALVFVGGGRGL